MSLVEPNKATKGVFSVAATCIGPLSLVRKTEHFSIKGISSHRDVFPAILKTRGEVTSPQMVSTREDPALSPKYMIEHSGSSERRRCVKVVKRSGSQHFAEPYCAPGFMPMTRFSEERPREEKKAATAALSLSVIQRYGSGASEIEIP